MLEEDDAEFDDVIEEPGVMVGEDWLVSGFALPSDQG